MRVNHSSVLFARVAATVGAVLGFAVAWVGSSPALGMGINWDAAGYLADIASGRAGWSAPPWSSHYALGQVYVLCVWLARVFGGTVIDGGRLLGALSLGCACATFFFVANTLCRARLIAALLTAVFATAWGVLLLVFTLEDNLVFLPASVAALAVAVRGLSGWRPRHSVLAGALVGLGTLMSWQAGLYLFIPLYVAVVLGGAGRGMPARARDGVLVVVAMFAARIAWALLYWTTSTGLPLRALMRTLFARPQPSFFPSGLAGWLDVATHWPTLLRRIGGGVVQELAPGALDSLSVRGATFGIGVGILLALLALCILSARQAARSNHWQTHLLAVCLLAFTAATALYVDLPEDRFKRYDYLPVLLPLLAAALVGAIDASRAWLQRMAALVTVLIVIQGAAALRHNRIWHAQLPSARPANYVAHGGETWFAYMRRLHQSSPGICVFVFGFDELSHARFQLEIVAALRSELPAAVVLGDPALMKTWDRPLPMVSLASAGASLRGCEWLSDGARGLLGR